MAVDYRSAEIQSHGRLRPIAEVIRRGVLLPDGKLECVTCHDPRSQWADHIALPPGATVRPDEDAEETNGAAAAQPVLAPGSRVSPKPLCLACHALD